MQVKSEDAKMTVKFEDDDVKEKKNKRYKILIKYKKL